MASLYACQQIYGGTCSIIVKPLIEISNLTFFYEGAPQDSPAALSDISIAVMEGESVGIAGANGAGKSTLLRIIVGLLPGYTGQVKVNGMLLGKNTLKEIRRLCGYVFQEPDNQLFMPTVYEDAAFGPLNYGLAPEEADAAAVQALRSMGIERLRDKPIHRLSGGEKKLAALASVLALSPSVLLLDEPSASLDPAGRRNLINLLNGISSVKIIASHDLDFICDTCKRVILIKGGKVVRDGTRALLRDKALLEGSGLELPLSMIRR